MENAEFLIAVTNIDEVNQVVCMMAHRFNVHRKIARVRNKDCTDKNPILHRRDFNINRMINPEEVTIDYILKVLETPDASDAGDFAEGEILLRGFHVTAGAGLNDQPLHVLKERHADFPFLIAAIQRKEGITIPKGTDVIKEGDTLYLLMTRDALPNVQNMLAAEKKNYKVNKVVVAGAERMGLELALRLEVMVDSLALVDENEDLCQSASTVLACISNIGPGLAKVGAVQNYTHLPDVGKVLLSFCMLLGRLEFYSVLILFLPLTWKR